MLLSAVGDRSADKDCEYAASLVGALAVDVLEQSSGDSVCTTVSVELEDMVVQRALEGVADSVWSLKSELNDALSLVLLSAVGDIRLIETEKKTDLVVFFTVDECEKVWVQRGEEVFDADEDECSKNVAECEKETLGDGTPPMANFAH